MRRARGLTLTEAIIAIFLMVGGFIVVARCFHSALQISAVTSTKILATQVAQRHLETVKAWSRNSHQPRGLSQMTSWGSFNGSYQPDPQDPRFQVATLITAPPFYSPCTLFEQAVANGPAAGPLDPDRTPFNITIARRQVTAIVTWGGSDSVRLTTMICSPTPRVASGPSPWLALKRLLVVSLASQLQISVERPRPRPVPWWRIVAPWVLAAPPAPIPAPGPVFAGSVVVDPSGPSTLSHNQNLGLTAAFRNGTTEIPCRKRWAVLGPGTGTLLVSNDSNTAKFIHAYDDNGVLAYADGLSCQLEVTAIYRGLIFRGRSGVISLGP